MWTARRWTCWLLALSWATVLVHGFHPFAEDGGLYAAGVERTLDHSLFPHYTEFVTAHLRFSAFAPFVAVLVRLTHLSFASVLLLLDFLSIVATLAAAQRLLSRCISDPRTQLAGLVALASGWTLPVAGTSLYLMDPYVTARSFTLPLSLLAITFSLEAWPPLSGIALYRHPAFRCAVCLLLASLFHPLMGALALAFVLAIQATNSPRPLRAWTVLSLSALLLCSALQTFSAAESPAAQAAVVSRYYWFLSQWRWYELLGLLGPLLMLLVVLRSGLADKSLPVRRLSRAAIFLGLLAILCALLFARESFASHVIARLQPLRIFVPIYAVMLMLLGSVLYEACSRIARGRHKSGHWRAFHAAPVLAAAGMAAGLAIAAKAVYPDSPHVEWPWLPAQTHNAWVRAFLWSRENTPKDALFALDARYVNTDGEDAQVFRALSLRSALPDFSKDGGEASITPNLAAVWLSASGAQKALGSLDDAERDRRLQPFAVTWMVLPAAAKTAHPCPYRNEQIKVCRLKL